MKPETVPYLRKKVAPWVDVELNLSEPIPKGYELKHKMGMPKGESMWIYCNDKERAKIYEFRRASK